MKRQEAWQCNGSLQEHQLSCQSSSLGRSPVLLRQSHAAPWSDGCLTLSISGWTAGLPTCRSAYDWNDTRTKPIIYVLHSNTQHLKNNIYSIKSSFSESTQEKQVVLFPGEMEKTCKPQSRRRKLFLTVLQHHAV